MTIGELKKHCEGLPDDALVLFDDKSVIGLDTILGCVTRKVRKGTSTNEYFVSIIETSQPALVLYIE